jgi:hypothetical protein
MFSGRKWERGLESFTFLLLLRLDVETHALVCVSASSWHIGPAQREIWGSIRTSFANLRGFSYNPQPSAPFPFSETPILQFQVPIFAAIDSGTILKRKACSCHRMLAVPRCATLNAVTFPKTPRAFGKFIKE